MVCLILLIPSVIIFLYELDRRLMLYFLANPWENCRQFLFDTIGLLTVIFSESQNSFSSFVFHLFFTCKVLVMILTSFILDASCSDDEIFKCRILFACGLYISLLVLFCGYHWLFCHMDNTCGVLQGNFVLEILIFTLTETRLQLV